MKTVKDYIRTIVDFPHEGILFRDVTTLFADPRGFRICVDQLLAPYAGQRIDKVVGLEARGFILGGAVAHQLTTGFVPIRKKGKLPGQTISQAYSLEYGEAVWSCMRMPFNPASASCWWMTCWRPAAPPKRASSWWSVWAARSSAALLWSICPIWAGGSGWRRWGWRFMHFVALTGCERFHLNRLLTPTR